MNTIIFNALDWQQEDFRHVDDDGRYDEKFVIRMYGRCEDGKSVSVRIDNYFPEFYVEIPEDWEQKDIINFKNKVTLLQKIKRYSIKSVDVVKKHKFYYFTAGQLFKFIKFEFKTMGAMKSFAKIISNNRIAINQDELKSFKVYESNIDPYLRFMHIHNINASGWIKIKSYKENLDEQASTYYNVICGSNNVEAYQYDSIAPFKIASFDIECTSGDGSFPKPERKLDQVIQIGTVITVNGIITKKHIITLDTCDEINDVVVESYKTEKELLEAWSRFVIKEDPDVIIGYNIFGFDEKYLYDRWIAMMCNFDSVIFNYLKLDTDKDLNAYFSVNNKYLLGKGYGKYNRWEALSKKKEICEPFAKFSRLVNRTCGFRIQMLQSSGLGDNLLNYFEMEGRLQIDLMKVVQRDYKLSSWKLDSVAEHFMKREVKSIRNISISEYEVEMDNIAEIKVGNYIKIDENGDIIDNKLLIKSIDGNKFICMNNNNDWELQFTDNIKYNMVIVKDDITANDIFSLQKGTSKDRRTIAIYCIQDCILVSNLFDKLLILINNMSMANVCSVPLSYIFVRGQGIKSLSLVSKYCRLKNYLIPVVTKDNPYILKDNDNTLPDEKATYEGAIVFDPEIGFHPYPISVMDYNSLYPSSMIDVNISHEMLVNNEYYNMIPKELLENYTFNNVEFTINDNEIQTCTFAKSKDGSFGILPTILQDLLTQRKLYKKKKDQATDKFLQNIYDGLQLAFKVTANSLYGQLGAATSPISLKDCAASTTARGRFMLSYAKDYIENNFRDLLAGINVTGCLDFETPEEKDIVDLVNEITKENTISPKYNIMNIEKIKNGSEIVLHDLKFKPHFRIYSHIPKCMKKGIKILIQRNINKKFISIAYTVLTITETYFEIGLTCDKIANRFKDLGNKWMFAMVVYGDSVAKYTPVMLKVNNKFVVEEIQTIDKYGSEWYDDGTKQYCELNNVQVWSDSGWTNVERLIRHKLESEKKMFRIYTYKGLVDVTDDHSLLLHNQQEISPKDIKVGDLLLHSEYPEEIREIKSSEHIIKQTNIETQLEVQKILIKTILFNWNIIVNSSNNIYSTEINDNPSTKRSDAIRKIEEIEYNGYVYDLTTENHHFAAGIGKIVVHNTDSIFIRMNIINKKSEQFAVDKQALAWSIKLGEFASKMLKRRLPFPHNMEYEKTFYPWIIVSKKKYIGNKYGDNPDKFKPSDSMGMVTKRRDIPLITKKIFRENVNILMSTGDIQASLDFNKQFLKDLFNNKFPFYYFEISQTLKDSYAIKDDELDENGLIIRDDNNRKVTRTSKLSMKNIIDVISSDIHDDKYFNTKDELDKIKKAHIRLVCRMTERDPGNKPQLNDRIPYIFIETYHDKKKKLLQGDMIETPAYIRENQLKIDFLHYLTNHIKTPILQILSKVSEDAVQIFEKKIASEQKKRDERNKLELSKREMKLIHKKICDKKTWFNIDMQDANDIIDDDLIIDDAKSLITKYKKINL